MAVRTAMDDALEQAVVAGDIPGVVAMAADANGVVYQGAYGRRTTGGDAEMTLDTVFWIASMTKAVTSVAAMQQVERGNLSLDEPIGAVLPELADPQVLEGGRQHHRREARVRERQRLSLDVAAHDRELVLRDPRGSALGLEVDGQGVEPREAEAPREVERKAAELEQPAAAVQLRKEHQIARVGRALALEVAAVVSLQEHLARHPFDDRCAVSSRARSGFGEIHLAAFSARRSYHGP